MTPKYQHILLEEMPGGGSTMTNKVYKVMKINGPALTRDRCGRRIAARLEGKKKHSCFPVEEKITPEMQNWNGDLIQLLFSDGVYWRVGYTTFFNRDHSFAMMLHEVHEGPGAGHHYSGIHQREARLHRLPPPLGLHRGSHPAFRARGRGGGGLEKNRTMETM